MAVGVASAHHLSKLSGPPRLVVRGLRDPDPAEELAGELYERAPLELRERLKRRAAGNVRRRHQRHVRHRSHDDECSTSH